MALFARRIKMDDHPNRADRMWVLFEEGNIAHPLYILSDYEMDRLLAEIEDQTGDDDSREQGDD